MRNRTRRSPMADGEESGRFIVRLVSWMKALMNIKKGSHGGVPPV